MKQNIKQKNVMKIPVIINNRNLYTWPKNMVESLKTFDNIGEIIIVDNNSTYEPLLEWYKTNPCEIILLNENLGQSCPWMIGLPNKRKYTHYVVTDPDLDLTETPKDCLNILYEKLEKYSEYTKIGLSLSNYDVSLDSPYHHHLKRWSDYAWDKDTIEDGLLKKQIIDTTFGIYTSSRHPNNDKSCSLNSPYSAKHIPWEYTYEYLKNLKEENYEFYYYLENATSASSYRKFVSFDIIKNQ
jgi:glycosyltransferase involved in cell wall biosynthesis